MNFQVYFLTRRSDYIFLSSYQMFFHWYSNTTEVGWQFWRPSIPEHCSEQAQLEQVILYHVQLVSNICMNGELHSFYGQHVPMWKQPHRKNLHLNGISCVSVFPIVSCSVNGQGRAWNPFFSYPLIWLYIYIDKTPTDPSFFQAKHSYIPQPILLGEMFQAINNVGGSF